MFAPSPSFVSFDANLSYGSSSKIADEKSCQMERRLSVVKQYLRNVVGSNQNIKHAIHCCLFVSWTIWLIACILPAAEMHLESKPKASTDYGIILTVLVYFLRACVLLALPQVILNTLGLLLFNVAPEKPTLKGSPLLTPLICVRIVTRGDYPQLVRANVAKNMANCSEAGMENFLVEVVSDKPIGLPNMPRIREVVVPAAYRPRNGAMYKARALQYCNESHINVLADSDYVVHLDEETIMSADAVRGILNFVLEKKYDFGQGLITYANGRIVNWFTTLADSIRVADDMGKVRAQFYIFHKPVFSWKGSFIVSRVGAERDVSFDHGVRGSIAEDCYFAMAAYAKGYTFDFVDGEMYEKSPFNVWDFIQQRKRWMQGIALVVHAPEIAWRHKIFLACSLYAWLFMPLSLSNIAVGIVCPIQIQMPVWLNATALFVSAVNVYMYFFGFVKSVSAYRLGWSKFVLCLISIPLVIASSALLESIAACMALFGDKRKFYIVDKDSKSEMQTMV